MTYKAFARIMVVIGTTLFWSATLGGLLRTIVRAMVGTTVCLSTTLFPGIPSLGKTRGKEIMVSFASGHVQPSWRMPQGKHAAQNAM